MNTLKRAARFLIPFIRSRGFRRLTADAVYRASGLFSRRAGTPGKTSQAVNCLTLSRLNATPKRLEGLKMLPCDCVRYSLIVSGLLFVVLIVGGLAL